MAGFFEASASFKPSSRLLTQVILSGAVRAITGWTGLTEAVLFWPSLHPAKITADNNTAEKYLIFIVASCVNIDCKIYSISI
jgi:hypothetical protein